MPAGLGTHSAHTRTHTNNMQVLKEHEQQVSSLSWSVHNPELLLSGSFDKTAQVISGDGSGDGGGNGVVAAGAAVAAAAAAGW